MSEERHEDNAWAGGFAGFVAGLILYPAETLSTRHKVGGVKVLQTLWRHEGPLALWGGAPAGLMGTIPSSALYFVVYEHLKYRGELALAGRDNNKYLLPMVHLTAGGLGELLTSVIYVPFEVTKARMMLGSNPHRASNGNIAARVNYANSFRALYEIARNEGVRGLYAGYVPCMLTDMSFRGVTFMLYEFGKRTLVESRGGVVHESSVEDLALGFVSGGLAAFFTNPLDVLTIRAMTNGMGSRCSTSGAKMMFSAWWQGAGARVASLAPQSAVTLAVFEAVLRVLD